MPTPVRKAATVHKPAEPPASGDCQLPARRLDILLLCCENARHTGTVNDHINAFSQFSEHNVYALDSSISAHLDLDCDLFDAIVFHYSIVIALDSYLTPAFARRLAKFDGPKILYIQDEFRWVDRTSDAVRRLGIGTVFTVVNKDAVRRIYRAPWFNGVRFEHTLTGFVPQDLSRRDVPGYAARPVDVSYRARKLPFWCGSFALQKWQIGERFLKDADRYGLKCDIAMSEASRIYGETWIRFLASSRAVLGTESGASFVDYSGDVYKKIDRYQETHPDAPFERVRDLFLEGRDGETTISTISPRCFEAAALRTLMILYPGDYSGILVPGRHYVLLERDHSNMDEVVRTLRDPEQAQEIIDNAYQEIALCERWSFAAMVQQFDGVVSETVLQAKEDDTVESARITSPENRQNGKNHQVSSHLASLMKTYRRRQRYAQIRYRAAVRLQQAEMVARDFVGKRLPYPLSRLVLIVGRVVVRIGKPVLRRLLMK